MIELLFINYTNNMSTPSNTEATKDQIIIEQVKDNADHTVGESHETKKHAHTGTHHDKASNHEHGVIDIGEKDPPLGSFGLFGGIPSVK